jgi:DNA-binding response OmpR family regulator
MVLPAVPDLAPRPPPGPPPAVGPSASPPGGVGAQAATGLVLVVDDEAGLRSILSRLLRRAGWACRVAADGAEGVEAFEAERDRVALVLLDLTMPGMSGLEVLRHLRELDPAVPVVLMSGYAVERVPAEVLAQPGTVFVAKPFEPEEVLAQVRALARAPARAASR